MVGGFHVSGMLAMFSNVSPEIQQLVDAGVSVVPGEVEHRWADLLRDAYEGKLKPIYRFLDDPPDLSEAPRPIKHKQFTAKHVHSNYGTMDCSRGCPFNIQALLDVVPILNVTNDPAITKFAADIPAKLVSNSAVVLRDAEKIRKTTMAAAEGIMAKMNAYLA